MRKYLRFPFPGASLAVRIAGTRQELTGAFELVYRSYLARGYVQPHLGGVIYREAFGLPTSRTIIATAQTRDTRDLVGTLTVVGDNPLGLELETTYPREVRSLRGRGRNLAEITCLAIRPTDDFRPTAVFFTLTRFMIHYAYWRGFDDLLIAIHPRHHRFYWRHFRVSLVGPCRPHRWVNGNPSICGRIDLHYLKRNVEPELWQQYFAQGFPEREYRRPPIGQGDHRYLLCRSGVSTPADSSGHKRPNQDAA